jgi:hypothetical protein
LAARCGIEVTIAPVVVPVAAAAGDVAAEFGAGDVVAGAVSVWADGAFALWAKAVPTARLETRAAAIIFFMIIVLSCLI